MTTSTATMLSPELESRMGEAGVECVNGELAEKLVSIESGRVEAVICYLLQGEAMRAGGAWVLGPVVGYKCYPEDPTKLRKPDLSVVRTVRLAGIDVNAGFLQIPAELVIEVVSPTDLSYDVMETTEEYLRHGFGTVWVVHPNTRTVAIHRTDGTVSLLRENDQITGDAALPGFKCKVGDFFAMPA